MKNIKSLSEIKEFDKEGNTFLFDLDNTLLKCKDKSYGSNEWYEHIKKEKGLLFARFSFIYANEEIEVELTEKTPEIKNAKVFIITNRSVNMIIPTLKQLEKLGIGKTLWGEKFETKKQIKYAFGKSSFNTLTKYHVFRKYEWDGTDIFFDGMIMFCNGEKYGGYCLMHEIMLTQIKKCIVVDDDDLGKILKFSILPHVKMFLRYLPDSPKENKIEKFKESKIRNFILVLVGKMGSGKGAFLDYALKKGYIEKVYNFADSIKEYVSCICNVDLEKCYKNKNLIGKVNISKENLEEFIKLDLLMKLELFPKKIDYNDKITKEILEQSPMSLGKWQVFVGAVFRKYYGENYWATSLLKKLNFENKKIAIGDARFPSEIETFWGKAMFLRIERPYDDRKDYFCGRDPNDPSETAIDHLEFSALIHNDNTLEDFYKEIDKLFIL